MVQFQLKYARFITRTSIQKAGITIKTFYRQKVAKKVGIKVVQNTRFYEEKTIFENQKCAIILELNHFSISTLLVLHNNTFL